MITCPHDTIRQEPSAGMTQEINIKDIGPFPQEAFTSVSSTVCTLFVVLLKINSNTPYLLHATHACTKHILI